VDDRTHWPSSVAAPFSPKRATKSTERAALCQNVFGAKQRKIDVSLRFLVVSRFSKP
jgi:hypothetical protein